MFFQNFPEAGEVQGLVVLQEDQTKVELAERQLEFAVLPGVDASSGLPVLEQHGHAGPTTTEIGVAILVSIASLQL